MNNIDMNKTDWKKRVQEEYLDKMYCPKCKKKKVLQHIKNGVRCKKCGYEEHWTFTLSRVIDDTYYLEDY